MHVEAQSTPHLTQLSKALQRACVQLAVHASAGQAVALPLQAADQHTV